MAVFMRSCSLSRTNERMQLFQMIDRWERRKNIRRGPMCKVRILSITPIPLPLENKLELYVRYDDPYERHPRAQ